MPRMRVPDNRPVARVTAACRSLQYSSSKATGSEGSEGTTIVEVHLGLCGHRRRATNTAVVSIEHRAVRDEHPHFHHFYTATGSVTNIY